METTSLSRLQQLHPAIRDKAIDAYSEAVRLTPSGVHPYITETLRSFGRSADLYAQGRTKPGEIVTWAKAGQSYHNYGLALDFVIQVNGKEDWTVNANWMVVVNVFKSHGFTWGGDWKNKKDSPHFEMQMGHNWQYYLALHNSGIFIEGTNYVKI